jgi:hypothetical protein
MQVALVHEHFDESHLAQVVEEMKQLGAPTIRAVWMECYNVWAALEGCHRLRAAHVLGITPEIDEVDYSEETTTADLGISDDFDGAVWTVAEIADGANRAVILSFNNE